MPPAGPPAPPWFAAMRGSGSAVERLLVLHALLRQLDVDAVFVGDADGIWALGVAADGQLKLFDVRLGFAIPGPDGILTLAQARSLPDAFKALALDPALPYDVTAERAKRAEVLIASPLSSLSPRMRFLQSLLPEGTVRLADDPATRGRLRKALTSVDAASVRLKCSTELFAFLPASEGGGDPSPPGQRPRDLYLLRQVPLDLLPPVLQQLTGEAGNRMRMEFVNRVMVLMQPGHARELIIRGRYREATDKLVGVQEWAKRRPTTVQELEKNTRAWADAARSFYAEQSRRERGQGDPGGTLRLEELRTRMEELQRDVRGPQAYVDYVVADELAAQATYLLALSKHEEAERLLNRPESAASAKTAWTSAHRWWTSFVDKYPNRAEAPAARRNLARTLAASGRAAEAKAAYEALAASNLPPLDRLACRYLAASQK
jgi:hypothetical protein